MPLILESGLLFLNGRIIRLHSADLPRNTTSLLFGRRSVNGQ